MLNALVDNRDSSADAFQCGNVTISRHQCHSTVSSHGNRDLIMLSEAGNCGPKELVLCQDL